MIFRQLFDYETWTYTYLIADEKTREAALIDESPSAPNATPNCSKIWA